MEMDTALPPLVPQGDAGTPDEASLTPSDQRWANARVPYPLLAAVGLSTGAFIVLLYLTRRLDFFYDEWDFLLGAPRWTFRDYFEPHNGHWSTVPALIYKVILTVNGAHSYLPFMAVLLLLHVSAGLLLFLIVRRRSGSVPALAAIALILFHGSGYENIIWAFQVGFVGSVAFGLLAIYLLDEPDARPAALAVSAAALLLSVMSSGVGLVFTGTVAVDLLLDHRRRHFLLVLVAAVVAYAGWYLAIGIGAVNSTELTLGSLLRLVSFVPYGISAAAVGLTGLSAARWGQLALVGLGAVAGTFGVHWVRDRRIDPHVVAAGIGLVGLYALAGLVRSQMGDAQAAVPRYSYVGAVFLLLILTAVLRDLPWRGYWRFALLAALGLAATWNGVHLAQSAASQRSLMATQAVTLETVWALRDAPGLDRNAVVHRVLMPQVKVGRYLAAREAEGSPLPDVPRSALASLPRAAVDQTIREVLPLRVSVQPAAALSAPTPPSVAAAGAAAVPASAPAAGCQVVTPTEAAVHLTEPGGSTVRLRLASPGRVGVLGWLVGDAPDDVAPTPVDLTPAQAVTVMLPDAGDRATWRLRVTLPDYNPVTVCVSDR